MRRAFGLALFLTLVSGLSSSVATQSSELRVVQAGPVGELNQRDDANEIRVVFSEPMVVLGRIPSNPVPAWFRMQPAAKGTFRWSGTTVLIFTPDPASPLPNATRYTVTIDNTATSVAGRALPSPYSFTFTTPTVKLQSMRWYRRQDRSDQPVVLVLDFNQAVRPADIAAHVTVRYRAHEWTAPSLTARERARLTAIPDGVRLFNEKVAAARQAASRTDAVPVRVTTDWDVKRFPPRETMVVLETAGVPPPGTWLELTLDTAVPGVDGNAPPAQEQTSTAELTPMFFARGFDCRSACNPSAYNGLEFSAPVTVATFAAALGVRDITAAASEVSVARSATTVRATSLDIAWSPNLEDAGYERQPPARHYAYALPATFESNDGQHLGYPWVGVVENGRERAFTSFGDGHGVWETAGGGSLPFYSRNFRDVTEWLTRILPDQLMPRILELQAEQFRTLPPGAGTRRTLTVTPDATQSYGIDLTAALGNTPGLVWAGLRPGEPIPQSQRQVPVERADRSTLVQVTNLGINVKDSPQSTLVFVTRLDNGEPVPAANISIIDTENRAVWRGTTNGAGVAMAPALPLRKADDWYRLTFIVTAEKDGDIAYVGSNWNEGIMPWDFGYGYDLWQATDILRGSVFTDRGVYRPGEAIQVKAILRHDTPGGIRLLPAGAQIEISVRDSRNREVDRRTATVNRWSSAEWTWMVPADATLGGYSIQAMIPGSNPPDTGNDLAPVTRNGEWLKRVHGSFLVAAYRRPDFRVDTLLDVREPIAGAELSGRVEARYLFGSSLGARPVRWSVTRQPNTDIPTPIRDRFPEERFAFGYYPEVDYTSQRLTGATTSLNPDGGLSVTAPTVGDVDIAYDYTLEADVEDVSRQHIANRTNVTIHPAPWYIGIRRPAFFADVTTGTSVDVVAVDLQGNPVADVPVTLTLTRIQWNSVRRAEGGGFYTWETEEVRTPAGEWSVRSAAAPVPLSIPVPEGGSYVLTATANDGSGHRTRTEVSFYGIGRGYTAWQRHDHNRITLEPEKKTWRPGDTARIMIQSPWETATALMTVEREGVRSYERFTLTSTQQTISVPITEADIPNVYVSVLLVRGRTSNDPGDDGSDPGKPAFRLGYAELLVEDASKRLRVEVTADRKEYRPANNARVSVSLKDAASQPVAGEVTLWAVDYGVLSLTGYTAPNVLGSIYQQKSLQVMNEDSRQRIISRRVLTPKGEGDGGGGGADGGANDARRDFRPLAFWLGSVETDVSGMATREVTLPESLTTYRIMAVAADSASRFGSASAEFKVNEPVTLLSAFPRFLSLGDRGTFSAVVTNTLTTGGNAVVNIRSLDTNVLQFQGAASQTIQIGPSATAPVRFDALARSVGTARVRVTVTLGSESDAFETTLPITAPGPIETDVAVGDTDSETSERLTIPAGIVAGIGGLDVELSSTALVGLGEGARYLTTYPYAAAESKASSAIALLLAADLGSAFGMERIAPADYRARATSLLRDLERHQCSNGAFAYWAGRCNSVSLYLTAYVLNVMRTASTVGVASDNGVVGRALDYLEAELRRTTPPRQVQWLPVWSASQAYAVKVLADYKRPQDANITRLYGMADRLPVFALSYLADALTGSGTRDVRYADVVRRITNALRIEGDRAHVEEIDESVLCWIWTTNTRATSVVLEGFVRRGDDPVFVQRMVRWLLLAREDGHWGSTHENGMALEALVAYYRRFESEPPNMTATARIGTRTVGTATFQGRSTTTAAVRLAMPDLLRTIPAGADRELALSRAGTSGRLFYTARTRYVLAEPPPSLDQGIRIERRYERFAEEGNGPASTSFAAGDLVRVTLTVTVPQERRYVAVNDPIAAGFEAVDSWFRTTATDLAREASVTNQDDEERWWFDRTGFDHVEKYDDHVSLFATRLAEGRHEFSYLVRATTAGTFRVAGASAEEMYAPEVRGRAIPVTVVIK